MTPKSRWANIKNFWNNVDKNGPVINPKLGRCWLWTGSLTTLGYGPHRLSWSMKHGPIPKGKYICHKCDNPPCIRLSHLFCGTPKDNAQDMLRKGRNRPSDGGWNAKGNKQRRQQLAARMKKQKYGLGHKLSPEHIESIRQAVLGNQYGLGYRHTPEALAKISRAQLGRKRSEETKRKMREAWARRRRTS